MSRKSWPLLGAVGLALAASSGVATADMVDQSQLSNTVFMSAFSQTDLAQSFQQAHGDISGASIQLRAGVGDGGAGGITIALYDNLPNAGGNLLAEGTATGVTAGDFATVHWADLAITADTAYYLVFTSTNNSLGIGGDTSNPYPRGQVYANAGYGPYPTFDYAFQTFYGGAGVPEPGSIALLGIGAAGLAGMASRRLRTPRPSPARTWGG